MRLLIVAGHGAGDPGACAFNYREATLNREVAEGLYAKLSGKMNVALYDTSRNFYSDLKAGKYSILDGYTHIIEIHFNACVNDISGDGKSTGTEILVHKYNSGNLKLENELLKNLCDCGWKNRGIKYRSDLQNMNICYKRNISYFLIEMCFVDDKDDMDIYKQFKNWNIDVFADTILDHFGIEDIGIKPSGKPVETPVVTKFDSVEQCPYGKDTIQKLIDKGLLKGNSDGKLNLSEDMLRVFIVNDRAGLYD